MKRKAGKEVEYLFGGFVIGLVVGFLFTYGITTESWQTNAITNGVGEFYQPNRYNPDMEFRWKTNTIYMPQKNFTGTIEFHQPTTQTNR